MNRTAYKAMACLFPIWLLLNHSLLNGVGYGPILYVREWHFRGKKYSSWDLKPCTSNSKLCVFSGKRWKLNLNKKARYGRDRAHLLKCIYDSVTF